MPFFPLYHFILYFFNLEREKKECKKHTKYKHREMSQENSCFSCLSVFLSFLKFTSLGHTVLIEREITELDRENSEWLVRSDKYNYGGLGSCKKWGALQLLLNKEKWMVWKWNWALFLDFGPTISIPFWTYLAYTYADAHFFIILYFISIN